MTEIQEELFSDIMTELPELFLQHWIEVGSDREKVPLSPDWNRYLNMQKTGMLHIVTARDGGKLIGYYFGLAYPHLHYSTSLMGFCDGVFIIPEKRGILGVRIVKAGQEMFAALGVKRVYVNTSNNKALEAILESLGYSSCDQVYSLTL